MKRLDVSVIYEDNHLLVVNKPSELATMGAEKDEMSLVDWGKDYIKRKYNKPGNVFLGVVSRLDSFTSGVIVLARTSKAASRLSAQFRDRKVEKLYLAVCEGRIDLPKLPSETPQKFPSNLADDDGPRPLECLNFQSALHDKVWKDDAAKRMRIQNGAGQGGGNGKSVEKVQEASLQIHTLAGSKYDQNQERTLLLIRLLTGRKHQIRVQLSGRGFPIFGDQKYGASYRLSKGIALHCYGLQFKHPTGKQVMTFLSKPPKVWTAAGEFQIETIYWEQLLQRSIALENEKEESDLPSSGNVQSLLKEFEKKWLPQNLGNYVFSS